MPKPFCSVLPGRAVALVLSLFLAACGGVPLEDLKASEFRVVREAQKPLWAYSQCLAERFERLRGGPTGSRKLTLSVNVTRSGVQLMSREAARDAALSYWYFVEVRPTQDGVRTSAWVCRCFNRPTPQEMLAWIDDAIQICGSVGV